MDATVVSSIALALGDSADDVVGLLTTFVPILAGVAVAGLAIKLVPKLIKRVGSGL